MKCDCNPVDDTGKICLAYYGGECMNGMTCGGNIEPKAPVKIHLIPHDGGPCPVEGYSYVTVKLRFGTMLIDKAIRIRWDHKNTAGDIIAYCPIEIKEGE